MGPGGPLRYAASPVSRARRITAAAAVALVASGVLSACTGASPYAAVVDGTTISKATLVHDLTGLGSNAGFVAAFTQNAAQAASQGQQAYPVFAADTANRTFTQGFATVVLNTDIQGALIHAEVVRRHVEPSKADIDGATAAAEQQFPSNPDTGKPVFEGFPRWFQQEFKVRVAEASALSKALGPVATDTAAVNAFYQAHPEDFIATQCVSHIVVSSQAEAAHVRAELAKGAAFVDEARRYSRDTASAIKGGDLGCATPQAGAMDPTVLDVSIAIAVNQPSQPVHSASGWEVIEVRSRQMKPLDAAETTSIQQYLQSQGSVGMFLTDALTAAKVSVNPAYGSWDPLQRSVVPPVAPPGSDTAPTTVIAGP